MKEFLFYIARSGLYLGIFYAFYLLVMRRMTFFRLNRAILLLGSLACGFQHAKLKNRISMMLKPSSGRMKVAPEHTSDKVLGYMAKPSFRLFERLRKEFDGINRRHGTHVELVPYFISSHPGCTLRDMQELAHHPALKGIWMDQVQDFMPTPMTTSSVMFYSGIDPRTMKPVFVERDPERKRQQKSQFFKKR